MMNKFESKLKASLVESSELAPDYWKSISKKTNISGSMIMKKINKRNIFSLRYGIPAVCGLALVITLTFIYFTPAKPVNLGGKEIGNQTVENLQINNIVSPISAKIKLPDNGTTDTISYDAYLKQAGMKLDLWLPAALKNTEDAYVYFNEDGSEFMMSGYTFNNPSSSAALTIRFQKGGLPLTDTKYQLENQKASKINGEDIVIGYGKDIDTYFTTFIYQGIGYDITSTQLKQDEFVKVIQSILK